MNNSLSRLDLVMQLRKRGICDTGVLRAIEQTPRELFVDPAFVDSAYIDMALPIGCGQTISQPYVVAYMTEALAPAPDSRMLEVGTGSGYQTAILARLCRNVYTIERHEPLLKLARQRFRKLGLDNITSRTGDGWQGWPGHLRFDRIIVTAAAAVVPPPLVEQLAEGGRMILPLGETPHLQHLALVEKGDDGITITELLPVRFVPLIRGPVEPAR